MAYTVEQLTADSVRRPQVSAFIKEHADKLNELYGLNYDWFNGFYMGLYLDDHVFLMCFDGERPLGFMVGSLTYSVFDFNKTMLRQEILFSVNPMATKKLIERFVDIGRNNVNLIFMCRATHTNIKEKSFNKLGFRKIEELYLMEVGDE